MSKLKDQERIRELSKHRREKTDYSKNKSTSEAKDTLLKKYFEAEKKLADIEADNFSTERQKKIAREIRDNLMNTLTRAGKLKQSMIKGHGKQK